MGIRTVGALAEWVIGGGRIRERVLVSLLGMHYQSRFRREWLWARSPPHFFNHRLGAFNLAFRRGGRIDAWQRAFFVAEMVRTGDRVLDIGCGDGFFTARFYAPRCEHVDAIDIEPSAIRSAREENAAPNVNYILADAVTEPFPSVYDVIVWDGAIGHFAPEVTLKMLEKIRASLKHGGVFCGSESLGAEGSDHLQYFPDIEAVRSLLGEVFPHVLLRQSEYPVRGLTRREAYWRCSTQRLDCGWA